MGIFNITTKKSKENKQGEDIKEIEIEKPFVPDISLYEFEKVNWAEFGTNLKQNKILPNSYGKKPVSVDIKLSGDGVPMVLLTFNSSTSDSVREYLLLQDGVYQSVNGVIDDGKNQELIDVWNDFKKQIRLKSRYQTDRESVDNKRRAKKMIEDADKILRRCGDFYELEQTFLEKYKDVKFDDFTWFTGRMSGETIPAFIPLLKEPVHGSFNGEPVIPFSPRTLEHCLLHMTNGEKAHHGEYVGDFEKMCRKIQEVSCYESADWDKVINIGQELVKNAYQLSVLENSDKWL